MRSPIPAMSRRRGRGPAGGSVVIGHRGAPAYRPEHTLAAYELAARQGADCVEPDLVSTRDAVLVARHEPELSGTTDVGSRAEFGDRRTTKDLDGVATTGWFAEDFTLAELKTLRARERMPALRPRNTAYDGRFGIPTVDEVLRLCRRLSRELGRTIEVHAELKHPTYLRAQDLAPEPPLVAALARHPGTPVLVQSFEVATLRALRERADVPLIQLLWTGDTRPYDFAVNGDPRTYADLATLPGLREIAEYADGAGSPKGFIVPRDGEGASLRPTGFVEDAHAAGLAVHAYTFRAENAFLPAELRSSDYPADHGDLAAEVRQFLALGVDGVTTDSPDMAVSARVGAQRGGG